MAPCPEMSSVLVCILNRLAHTNLLTLADTPVLMYAYTFIMHHNPVLLCVCLC